MRPRKPRMEKEPDDEQRQLGSSDRFWTRLRERRGEKTISRAELEERLLLSKRESGGE